MMSAASDKRIRIALCLKKKWRNLSDSSEKICKSKELRVC